MIRRAAAAAVAIVLLQGCAPRPEQALIGEFFAASRLRDLTALARLGTVAFEPRERGIVTTFTIRSVSDEITVDDAHQKDVVIEAPVHTPDGRIETQVLLVRLQRRTERAEAAPAPFYNGWIVTSVVPAPFPAGPPPS